jgi:hypothetical protein
MKRFIRRSASEGGSEIRDQAERMMRPGLRFAPSGLRLSTRPAAFCQNWILPMGLPPLTKDEADTINLYAALMEEVKVRVDAFNWLITGRSGLSGSIIRESCFLQLRFLCELIALGCLVAHGDIKGARSKSLRGTRSYNEGA